MTDSSETIVSAAFLEYLDLEESGVEFPTFLMKYPDIAPKLEKKINAHRLLRQAFSILPSVESSMVNPSDCPLYEGEHVGDDFQVLRELGRGGMGVIYLARQLSIDRLVAIKILSAHIAASKANKQRFLNEARAIGKLRHPNIVNVHLAGELRGMLFIVMEYVPGVALDKMISELSERNAGRPTGNNFCDRLNFFLKLRDAQPQMPIDYWNDDYSVIVARLIKGMARALEHAHRQGIIHRDIKPSNVLIDEQGQGRLIDFGLNMKVGSQGLTESFELFGSAYYLAPERLNGGIDSELVDIYGLGVTLYEALTLRIAFKGKTISETLDLLKRNKPVLPRRINPLIPRSLEGIVMTAIDRNPRRRYQSASDFADDLDRFLEGLPVRARPVSRVRMLAGWIRRPFFIIALGISVAAIFLSPWRRIGNYMEEQAILIGQRLERSLVNGVTAWFKWALESSIEEARHPHHRTKVHNNSHETKLPANPTSSAKVDQVMRDLKKKYGLTMTPPNGWQVDVKNDEDALILFRSNDGQGATAPCIGVFVYKSKPDDEPKKLVALKRRIAQAGGKFKIYGQSKIRISGLDGTLDTYSVRIGTNEDKYSRLTVFQNGNCIQVLYAASLNSFDRHKSEFKKFISSLLITSPNK